MRMRVLELQIWDHSETGSCITLWLPPSHANQNLPAESNCWHRCGNRKEPCEIFRSQLTFCKVKLGLARPASRSPHPLKKTLVWCFHLKLFMNSISFPRGGDKRGKDLSCISALHCLSLISSALSLFCWQGDPSEQKPKRSKAKVWNNLLFPLFNSKLGRLLCSYFKSGDDGPHEKGWGFGWGSPLLRRKIEKHKKEDLLHISNFIVPFVGKRKESINFVSVTKLKNVSSFHYFLFALKHRWENTENWNLWKTI